MIPALFFLIAPRLLATKMCVCVCVCVCVSDNVLVYTSKRSAKEGVYVLVVSSSLITLALCWIVLPHNSLMLSAQSTHVHTYMYM